MLDYYTNMLYNQAPYMGSQINPAYWQSFFNGPGTLTSLPDNVTVAPGPVTDNVVAAPVATASAPQTATPPAAPAPTADSMRQQFLKEADTKFGSNYGNRVIQSSLLDDTINSILAEQRGQAQSYLDRGKARGIYNDIGYNAGRNTLDNAALAGASRVRGLGNDLISGYRTSANQVRDRAYEAIGGVTPGREFSLDPYITEANDVVGRAQQNASGDLRNALGSTNLFDFSALNNQAGQAQGAINMRDADVATALRERRRVNSQIRGLGSQGAF